MTKAHTRFSPAGTKKVPQEINLNSESTATKTSSSAKMVKLKVIFRKEKAISCHLNPAKLKFLSSLSFCKKMISNDIRHASDYFFIIFIKIILYNCFCFIEESFVSKQVFAKQKSDFFKTCSFFNQSLVSIFYYEFLIKVGKYLE